MIRTTHTLVRAVIQTGLDNNEIEALIIQAHAIVDANVGTSALSETTLQTMETWMAAHLIAIGKERQPISEKVGDIWLQWEKHGGKGFLEQTTYGQMVLFLDTTGNFQKSSYKRAYIKAVKQNDYPMGHD